MTRRRRLVRRTGAALGALLPLFAVLIGFTAPAALADANHFSVDFSAAAPNSYDPTTGEGGTSNNVVDSLEGGDFACGDTVVFFAEIAVAATETQEHTVELDFEFTAQSSGQPGVGFGSITGVSANTPGDPGHVTNGNEAVTLLTQSGGHPGPANLTGTVQITNLGVGDTQFILRIETLLACTPGQSPTGNLQAALTAGRVTSPAPSTINTGRQTIPFQAAGQVAFPAYTLTKTANPEGPVTAGEEIGFDIVITNTGDAALTEAMITDQLPAADALTWAEDPDLDECSIDGADLLTCDFGTIEVGGLRTVHVTATSNEGSCGLLTNTANATTGNAGDLSATADVTVLCPTIAITKVASEGAETVNAGDVIAFDISVSIGGDASATDVVVSDTLPTLPSGGEWTITPPVEGCSIDGQELSCLFDSLAPGTVVTIHVEAPTTTDDCDTFENVASVTTGNAGSGEAGASVTVQCPNVRVEKGALRGRDTVNAGEVAGFAILITNDGPGTATNVTLEDELPAGFGWVELPDRPDCDIVGGVLSCDIASLIEGGTVRVRVAAATGPETCGVFPNTATVGADGDTNPDDNTATAQITVLCPTIDITKDASAGVVNAGESVGFDIVVTVGGDEGSVATDVVVSDTLPTLPSGGEWTITPAVEGCSIDGQELSCSFESLAAGTVVEIHVEAPTTVADCDTFENVASVATGNNGADMDDATVTVQCPNVAVEKLALDGIDVDADPSASETVNAGDPAGFAITITNEGPGTATNVTLDDELPAGFDWVVDPDDPNCEIAGGVLSCDFASLAEGESVTVTVTAPTGSEETCGAFSNTAMVGADGDTDPDDNTSTAEITVQCPVIEITKTADADSVNAGDPIGFTITVTNNGPGEARDVTLTDDLTDLDGDGEADGLVWVEDPDNPDCEITEAMLSCDFGDLAENASASVQLSAETSEVLCATYTNMAVASATNHPEVEASDTTTVLCPGLNVAKTATAPSVDAGDPIGFDIVVINTGLGTAAGVTLSDQLPTGEGIDWAITATEGVDAGCDISDDEVVTCGPVDLGVDESFTVHVESPTEFASCAVYDNTAVADADNSDEVESSASTEVQCPELAITKTADADRVDAGDPIGFTISVTNGGPGAATDVVVTDELPSGSGIVWSESPDVEACSIVQGTLTCEVDELGAGATFIVHVSSPTSEAACGTYDNLASADAANDPTVEAGASTEVICPAEPPAPPEIPPQPPAPPQVPPETPAPPTGGLALTGAELRTLIALGVLMVAAGSAAGLRSRRRRRRAITL